MEKNELAQQFTFYTVFFSTQPTRSLASSRLRVKGIGRGNDA